MSSGMSTLPFAAIGVSASTIPVPGSHRLAAACVASATRHSAGLPRRVDVEVDDIDRDPPLAHPNRDRLDGDVSTKAAVTDPGE